MSRPDYGASVNGELLEIAQQIVNAVRRGVDNNLVPSVHGNFSLHINVRGWNPNDVMIDSFKIVDLRV